MFKTNPRKPKTPRTPLRTQKLILGGITAALFGSLAIVPAIAASDDGSFFIKAQNIEEPQFAGTRGMSGKIAPVVVPPNSVLSIDAENYCFNRNGTMTPQPQGGLSDPRLDPIAGCGFDNDDFDHPLVKRQIPWYDSVYEIRPTAGDPNKATASPWTPPKPTLTYCQSYPQEIYVTVWNNGWDGKHKPRVEREVRLNGELVETIEDQRVWGDLYMDENGDPQRVDSPGYFPTEGHLIRNSIPYREYTGTEELRGQLDVRWRLVSTEPGEKAGAWSSISVVQDTSRVNGLRCDVTG